MTPSAPDPALEGTETCPARCGGRTDVYVEDDARYYVVDAPECRLRQGRPAPGCSAVHALRAALGGGPIMVGPFTANPHEKGLGPSTP